MVSILSLDDINDLLKKCLLPELLNDLDSVPIEKEHFKAYHENLEIQLPLLYDWIQQQQYEQQREHEIEQEQWLFTLPETTDTKKIEFYVNFVLVLCELANPNAIYVCTDKPEFINNAQRLLNQCETISVEVERNIFQYYQKCLSKDKWKKNLGAIHGFLRYLKYRYKASTNSLEKSKVLFALSVGLNVKSVHENYYKSLGIEIFEIMLNRTQPDAIRSMNIHQVIYESVLKDIHNLDSAEFIENVLKVLLKCLDFHTDLDSLEWSCVDDILDILIRNVTLASDVMVSIYLLRYINKLLVYFNINRQVFEKKLNNDLNNYEQVNELRALSQQNTSYSNHRWAKAILQMFVLESHKLMLTPDKSILMLMELHKCYMICMLPIHLAIIEPHLITFYDKFIVLLMGAVKHHKEETFFIESVTYMLDTFYSQLLECPKKAKLFTYKKAFHKLLQREPFNGFSIAKYDNITE